MTPAEFKTIRSIMGTSQADLSNLFHVNQSSIQRWERGIAPIPEDVARTMTYRFYHWNEHIAETVDKAMEMVEEQGKDPEAFEFTIYPTASSYYKVHPYGTDLTYSEHIAKVGMLYTQLLAADFTVRINYVKLEKENK